MGFDVAVRMSIPDGDDFGPDILAPRKLRNHQRASAFASTALPGVAADRLGRGHQDCASPDAPRHRPHHALDTYGHLWPDADESTRTAIGAVIAGRMDSAADPLRTLTT
jgi:hypothetical protein